MVGVIYSGRVSSSSAHGQTQIIDYSMCFFNKLAPSSFVYKQCSFFYSCSSFVHDKETIVQC